MSYWLTHLNAPNNSDETRAIEGVAFFLGFDGSDDEGLEGVGEGLLVDEDFSKILRRQTRIWWVTGRHTRSNR
jgi:hypothetical protein